MIEWGKHRWLDCPSDEKWKDTILINTTHYRWPINIDFSLLNEHYPGKLVFISANETDYNNFGQITSLQIPLYTFTDFQDLCIAIKSCKLFVGSLSAPLTIANAFHTDRIVGLCSENLDNTLNLGLTIIWDNIKYDVISPSN
jgi:ADP-heptose:LPS heptosyltransferase